MSVATLTTFCLVKHIDTDKLTLFTTGNDHLGDTLAVINDEVFLRQVNQNYTNLTTIVGINSAWGVQHCQTMLQRQSATWTYLCLVALGQCNMQTRWNESSLHRVQRNGFTQIGTQIHASTLWSGIGRQLLMAAIDNLYLYHLYKCFNIIMCKGTHFF